MRIGFATVLLTLAASNTFAATPDRFSFYGTWKVDAIVGYSEISVGQDQLRGLIGQQIVISNSA